VSHGVRKLAKSNNVDMEYANELRGSGFWTREAEEGESNLRGGAKSWHSTRTLGQCRQPGRSHHKQPDISRRLRPATPTSRM
jgi:hypothetical protein